MRRFYRQLWMWWIATLLTQSIAAHAQLRFVTVVPAAANTTVADEDGDFPAYIEIRSLETGILSGHYLTDDPQKPNAWQVPAGYVLTQGQTIRIFASGKNRRPTGPGGILHTSFTYDCSVPYCGLFNAQLAQVHTFSDRTDRCRCEGLSLLKERTMARTLIPTEDIGLDWTLPGYNDKGWIRGPTGIGYDIGNSPLRPGLILYHTFDKAHVAGTTVPDLSGPILHTGSSGGDPAMVQGRVAEAFDFPGVNSRYVLVPHHTELNPGLGHYSVALWFRPTRSGATTTGGAFEETLVSKLGPIQANSPTVAGWAITRNPNGTFVRVASAAGARSVALGTTSVNEWHHAVLVIDRATHQLVGYLDGKRMGATALASAAEAIATLADMVEGRDLLGSAPYAGRLDDVAVWARALTDAEVAQLFALGQQGKSLLDPSAFPGGGSLYAPLIGTDVLAPMRGVNSSAYIRVPFQVPAVPSIAVGLKLRVHYDDGFVLYLNGAEVARRNAPDPVDYLSAAPVDRPDPVALAGEWIDLSSYVGLLKPGGNLLAFHAMNFGADDERFLLAPTRLCLEVVRNPPTGGQCVKETNGRDFWLAFPENYVQEADTPLQLTICIAGVPQTKGIVEIPGLAVAGFPKAFTIPPSGSLRLALPRAAELTGPDSLEKKGVHVIADANVAVYGTTRMDYTTDTFLALPTPCLGVEYFVSSFKNVFDGLPILNGSQ
ncbi:MAG: LamG domain-containing protein, partial [Verrucomicrobiales bacterium]|nr:LamG domain-containing protein [Verrucomicrobiales bacterium]